MQEMQSPSSKKAELDNSLSKILFNYVLPFFDSKYSVKKIKIKSKKPDISLLEKIILSKIDKEKVKVNKNNNFENKKTKENFDDFLDELKNNNWDKLKSNGNIDYSLELIKENTERKPYSVSVTYEENSEEERLEITVKPNNYSLNKINESIKNYSNNENSIKNYSIEKNPINKLKNKEDAYSISITRKKQNKSNYSVKIKYEDNYEQERLLINYKEDSLRYKKRRENSLQDFSDRVPGKFVNVFPESMLGGILGFTYLGENFMGKREDMVGNQMVDVHESIHTNNEYETRLLTSWILSREKVKYTR